MSPTKITKSLLLLLLTSALLFAGCDSLPFPSQPTPTPQPIQSEPVIPTVSATGVIVPAQFTTLSMSTAGLVAEILVAEGDQIEEGQVLVRLKGREETQAAIAAAQFEVSAAQKALDDLEEAAESAATAALEAIPVFARQVRDAQYQLDNYTIPAEQQDMDPMEALDVMAERLDQARSAFDEVKSRSSNDPTRRDRKEDLDEAQSDYNAAVRWLEYVTELQVAQTNLDKARRDYELYKAGPDPEELAVAQARLDNALAALEAAQSALDDLELHALFSGTVSELHIRVGEWIVPGQPTLQIADLAHLRVETTDLNEIDAARVTLDSRALVSFDALNDTVNGVVASIAPKASAGSGVNYTVVIELEELPEALRWGMTAFVDIEVE
jgi:multidrug efflux pump subunit AcrA (membrane-fusion protein)